MKKVQDWNIKLQVHVENNMKKIQIVCSVHTNVHQIKLEILKTLGMLLFDTELNLFYKNSAPMKPTSSLIQNGIDKSVLITAILTRIKENKPLDLEGTKKAPKNKDNKVSLYGLSLLCACVNQSCANFGEDVWINLGYGNHKVMQIVSSIKCEICPYRSQFLRPTMMCKQIKVSNCAYRMVGTETNKYGIPIDKQETIKRVTKEKDIKNIIQKWKWNSDALLMIKHL